MVFFNLILSKLLKCSAESNFLFFYEIELFAYFGWLLLLQISIFGLRLHCLLSNQIVVFVIIWLVLEVHLSIYNNEV